MGVALRAAGGAVWSRLPPRATTLAVATALFLIAYDGGSYGQASRNTIAVAVWWSVIVCVAVGIWPAERFPRAALLTGGFLVAFAILTLASTAWAGSAERAFADFNRASLYLGVLIVVVLASRRSDLHRWADGVALGVTAISLLALTSRLLPDVVSSPNVRVLLPAAYSRLSYPLGYWNALAILLGMAAPLVLRAALAASTPALRGLSLAALPLLAATVYLTSSRGGVATAFVGLVFFLVFTSRRADAFIALACAAPGAAIAIVILLARPELVNDPATAAGESQGSRAALLLALTALATGLLYGIVCRLSPAVRVPRLAGRVLAAAAVGLALVGVAAAHPLERFRTFKAPPPALTAQNADYVRAHLLSGNGSGRWQLWASAVDEFQSKPLLGRGGGSYEAWWAQHGTLSAYVRNAHSLYLETLGELGVLGLILLGGALAAGLGVGLRRTFRAAGDERMTIAAVGAALAGYLVAAGVDWIWELTAVSITSFVLLGLLVGPATVFGRVRLVREADARAPRRRLPFGVGIAVVAIGWLLICAHAVPLLVDLKLRDSQAAAAAGNAGKAIDDALAARNIQPWAASPYQQLALVADEAGALPAAEQWIRKAIKRDSTNWQLWVIAARVETKAGRVAAARKSLARARELNPRSPLFRSQAG